MNTHLFSSQLLKYFGENEPKNPTPEERTISHRLSRIIKDGLKMTNFFDIATEGQMHGKDYTGVAEEPESEYKEHPRQKKAGKEVPLEVMTKATAIQQKKKGRTNSVQRSNTLRSY